MAEPQPRWTQPPAGATAWYRAAYRLCLPLARGWLAYEVIGREHLPAAGGILVAANHASYLDIPLVGMALPRMADFMGKIELFEHPLSGWLYRRLGGFAIRRGRQARDGLNEAMRRLRAGRVVVMFPEGGRNAQGLGRPMPGIGLIVAQTGAPVVPAYIAGAGVALPAGSWLLRPHPVTVALGRPIDFSGAISQSGREDYQAIGETVMARIAELEAELRRRRPESFAAPLRTGAQR